MKEDVVNPYQVPLVMEDLEVEEVAGGVLVQIKSVRLRAGMTLAFVGLCLLVKLAVLVRVLGGGLWWLSAVVSMKQFVAWDQGIGFIYFIWFLLWMFRSAQNAKLLDGELSDISPGMSVGCYFIPFYNLVGPYFAMRKITPVIARVSKMPLVWAGVWWALSILPSCIGAIIHGCGGPRWMAPALEIVPLLATAGLVIQLTRQQVFLYQNPPRIPRVGGAPRQRPQVPHLSHGRPKPKQPAMPEVALSPHRPKPRLAQLPVAVLPVESPTSME